MTRLSVEKNTHPRIGFVTFGDGSPLYRASANRLARNAKQSGWFSKSVKYEFKDIRTEFKKYSPRDFEKNRGFGYWLWKPMVLKKFAIQNVDLDLIMYADAGCHLNVNEVSSSRFADYVNGITASNPAVAFQSDHIERHWTKGDLLKQFNESHYGTGQFLATVLIGNRDFLINLCDDWIKLARLNNSHFLDDSNSECPNDPNFVEHRHDQSILSLLLKDKDIRGFPESETYSSDWYTMGDFPIWSTRYISGADFQRKDSLNTIRRKKDAVILRLVHRYRQSQWINRH